METPLVSILLLTMNHEKFIEQACLSALNQDYENLEIILLDNNSSDNTFKNAKKVLENSKIPVHFIQNTSPFGVAKNLNILVSQAKGELVCLLSGDDWLMENCISEKVKYMQNHKVDFVLSDGYKYLQEEKREIEVYNTRGREKIIKNLSNFFHINVTHNEPVNVGVMIKKSLLNKYPFDETIHAEDWDMNLRLTHLGYKIGFVDQKLFYYRIIPKSLSKNWELMELSYRKVTEKYLDYIKADPKLLKNYQINLLKYKFEKLLEKSTSEVDRASVLKIWKKEKYKIKYSQPVLFFKLLLLK